jgi:hypothetical protein
MTLKETGTFEYEGKTYERFKSRGCIGCAFEASHFDKDISCAPITDAARSNGIQGCSYGKYREIKIIKESTGMKIEMKAVEVPKPITDLEEGSLYYARHKLTEKVFAVTVHAAGYAGGVIMFYDHGVEAGQYDTFKQNCTIIAKFQPGDQVVLKAE